MTPPPAVSCPIVNRVDVSWVCVATNDPNPLHLDHEFARHAGFNDVVVPAHLLIGWIGQYFEEWCGGPANILRWRIRFSAPVWPGDEITLRGELKDAATMGGVFTGTVTATAKDGRTVGIATGAMQTANGSFRAV
jgi:acyl dehydratase